MSARINDLGSRFSRGTVDLNDLLIRVENDHVLLGELICIFKEEFPRLLLALRESVARGNRENIQQCSHALRGILSGLSVTRAAELTGKLERRAHAGERLELTETLALLEAEVENLLPELDSCVREAKP
jgi:HPt (histidine-containing phosphotransfer) domain-containing protein